LQVF
jgi:hypothetical protein